MCVIMYGRVGDILELDLDLAWATNPDGSGIIVPDRKGPKVVKGIMKFKGLIEALQVLNPETNIGLHLRNATHGAVVPGNTHPFSTGRATYIMHNGVLRSFGERGMAGKSDSQDLANALFAVSPVSQIKLLTELGGKYLHVYRDQVYMIGGFDKMRGVECSNVYWQRSKYKGNSPHPTRYDAWSEDGYGHYSGNQGFQGVRDISQINKREELEKTKPEVNTDTTVGTGTNLVLLPAASGENNKQYRTAEDAETEEKSPVNADAAALEAAAIIHTMHNGESVFKTEDADGNIVIMSEAEVNEALNQTEKQYRSIRSVPSSDDVVQDAAGNITSVMGRVKKSLVEVIKPRQAEFTIHRRNGEIVKTTSNMERLKSMFGNGLGIDTNSGQVTEIVVGDDHNTIKDDEVIAGGTVVS